MKLRFPENNIQYWADRYDYPRQEAALLNLRSSVRSAGVLSKDQLRLVAQWKAPRSAGNVEKNDDSYVQEISRWSFSATEERSKIEVLTLLNGVKWPTASVIMHLFQNQPYPILDFRALWSVNTEVPSQYSFDFWWPYIEFCRAIAVRNSVDMRTLDRALWQYSKENQKA